MRRTSAPLRSSTTYVADRQFTINTQEGRQTIYKGDIFNCDIPGIVAAGYTHELTRKETRRTLDEYLAEARELFGEN